MAVEIGGLRINEVLYNLVRDEIAPGTGVDPYAFWSALGEIVRDLGPGNRELLNMRDRIQEKMDSWYRERKGRSIDAEEYRTLLADIGYLLPEGDHFELTTARGRPRNRNRGRPPAGGSRGQCQVCAECGQCALGQSIRRPVRNERDSGGTRGGKGRSVQSGPRREGDRRGRGVSGRRGGAWHPAATRRSRDLRLRKWMVSADWLRRFGDGTDVGLADPGQFRGYRRDGGDLSAVLLVNNGPAHRDPDRPEPSGGRRASGGGQGRPSGVGGDDDPGLRGFGVGRGRRGQGAGIRKLERHHAGHAGDDL